MRSIRNLALAGTLALSALAACSTSTDTTDSIAVETTTGTDDTNAATTGDTSDDTANDTGGTTDEATGDADGTVTEVAAQATDSTGVGAETLAANSERHDQADDLDWNADDAVEIVLGGDSATASGEGVSVDGSTVTISAAGTYVLNGTLTDGQVVVESAGEGTVRLVLDGVDIHSSTTAPIAVLAADEVVVVLADGTENRLSDEASYTFADTSTDEPNATLFSAADLTIGGNGSLAVEGAYNDGIASKDGLVVLGGTITVDAVDDGIRGKDFVAVDAGTVTVVAGGDGVKADNDEDTTRGWISVAGGTLNVSAAGDGLDASTDVVLVGGTVEIVAGGGSGAAIATDASAKGVKGAVSVAVDGSALVVDAADDAVHSNDSVVIAAGQVVASTGDDGAHADATLLVSGGSVNVTDSYEGLESAALTITGGRIDIVASDDGINAAGGNDASGMAGPGGGGDGFAGGNYSLTVEGGTVVVIAGGDGLDINGPVTMSGGTVIVDGPTEDMNGALDYDGTFDISGGLLVATGSSGMAMAPSTSSAQQSVLATFATQAAGTVVHVQSTDGTTIVTFAPSKPFSSIVVSSELIDAAATYEVYVGGSSTGTATDGLIEGGEYSGGTLVATTTPGEAGTGMFGGGGRPPGRP